MKRFWRSSYWIVLLLLLVSTSQSAQAPIEEEDSTTLSSSEREVRSSMTIEQRVGKLERQIRNQANLLRQIEMMAQEVKELQGQLEVEAHDIKMLKEQQGSQYTDLDKRLTDLSHQKEAHGTLAINKKTNSSSENTVKDEVSAQEEQARKAYQAAYILLKNKNYDKAETAFQKFIQGYPKDGNIVNAHYWLGNIYLLKNRPDKAISQFKLAIKKDVQHTKTADALFKLGLAYSMQGNVKQANIQFKKVKQSYPDTEAAKLANEKL